jgi:hypothetical protein
VLDIALNCETRRIQSQFISQTSEQALQIAIDDYNNRFFARTHIEASGTSGNQEFDKIVSWKLVYESLAI